jgi:hypothetical protein
MSRAVELTLAALLLLILAAASLPAFSPLAPGSLWPWEKQLDGLVVVDSPEVYTRERLVNDRFMQTTWLLEQLDRYEPAAEFQELSQTIRQRSLRAGLGLSDGGTDATAEAVGGGQSPEGGTTPGASAIDRFRNEQSYRTEVRQAVLETMLDDRHDLQGNTLYMLKFDASIIPPRRIRHRNFAVISVDLERWSASGDGRGLGDDGGGYRTGEDMAPVSDAVAPARAIDPDAELHDVYLNWIEHIRDMVTDEYLNRIRIFLGQKSDEAELVEMWDGMGLNWTPSERDDHLRAAGKGAGAAATDDALETLQQFFHDYQRASGFRSTYRQTLRACSPPPDPGTPAFQDWQRRRNQPASAPLVQAYFTNVTGSSATSRPTLSQRMFEQIRRRILVSAAIAAAGGAAKERRDSELLLAESLGEVARTRRGTATKRLRRRLRRGRWRRAAVLVRRAGLGSGARQTGAVQGGIGLVRALELRAKDRPGRLFRRVDKALRDRHRGLGAGALPIVPVPRRVLPADTRSAAAGSRRVRPRLRRRCAAVPGAGQRDLPAG